MSRPVVRRTYGKSNPHPSTSSANPFGTPSSPFSFDLATPPSSPPPTKRARTHQPSSPLFDRSPSRPAGPTGLPLGIREPVSPAIAPTPKRAQTQATLSSFFAPRPRDPLVPLPARVNRDTAAGSSASASKAPAAKVNSKPAPHTQAQLRLTHLPLLHTCKECHMSYVRGGEDEAVHEKHHGRVLRGIPWDGLGRRRPIASSSSSTSTGTGTSAGAKNALRRTGSDGVGSSEQGWREVGETRFGKDGKGRARLLECDGSWGGAKLDEILAMVDVALSSPPLPPAIIERCKVYVALTCAPPPPQPGRARPSVGKVRWERERVVGVVVSQGIKWAMRVLDAKVEGVEGGDGDGNRNRNGSANKTLGADTTVVVAADVDRSPPPRAVDTGDGVMCDPTPLPTPLGIHRLYTIPSYRGTGLARGLLDAACAHTIYACPARPERGQVAFSQPTESGARMMRRWGGGRVRVFVDDESQI